MIAIPQNAAEALAAWNVVLDELETRKKFSLIGPFQHARVLKWTADVIELGFPIDVHAMGEMAADARQARRDARRSSASSVREQKNDQAVTCACSTSASQRRRGARSMLETTRDKSRAERTKREAEAREHPITKHVLQTFGAQIKEIKTDV